MSRAELRAARERYQVLRRCAADLTTLGQEQAAWQLSAEADELGATDIHVEVTCLVCGQDAGITARPDEQGHVGERGLCGPCNARITAEVEQANRLAEQAMDVIDKAVADGKLPG